MEEENKQQTKGKNEEGRQPAESARGAGRDTRWHQASVSEEQKDIYSSSSFLLVWLSHILHIPRPDSRLNQEIHI